MGKHSLAFPPPTPSLLSPIMAGLTGDAATRSTDTDALLSRLSCASLGYIHDPISPLLLSPSQRRSAGPRPALINIGTHARTWAIDTLVTQFLDSPAEGDRRQVLSLGAGTDGRFWRMKQAREEGEGTWGCFHWVEVDFAEATSSKARMVATKPSLRSALGGEPQIREFLPQLNKPPSLLTHCPPCSQSGAAPPSPPRSTPSSPATSGTSPPCRPPSCPTSTRQYQPSSWPSACLCTFHQATCQRCCRGSRRRLRGARPSATTRSGWTTALGGSWSGTWLSVPSISSILPQSHH